jgi:hypothetical protein
MFKAQIMIIAMRAQSRYWSNPRAAAADGTASTIFTITNPVTAGPNPVEFVA